MSEYVPILDASYSFVVRDGIPYLVFDDGVEYTLAEAESLSLPRLTPDDLRAVHLVKRTLGGIIEAVNGREVREVPAIQGKRGAAVQTDLFEGKDVLDRLAEEMGKLPGGGNNK